MSMSMLNKRRCVMLSRDLLRSDRDWLRSVEHETDPGRQSLDIYISSDMVWS
jgi:hypothetical protein